MCLDYIWSMAYQILEEYDNMVKAGRFFAHLVLRCLVQHGKWGRGGGQLSSMKEMRCLLSFWGLAGSGRLSGWWACHGSVGALLHTIVAPWDG